MIYLDISFLTPLFRQEAVSDQIQDCLAALPSGSLAISSWTRVEFASVIARDVRMKIIDAVTARRLIAAFDALADKSLHVLVPAAADFQRAQSFVSEFATQLRAPDALHLAIANSNGIEEILTLDEGLILAATRLGLKARRGIGPSRLPASSRQ